MTRSGKGSGGDELPGAIDSTSDIGRGSNDDPDSSGHGSFPVAFGDVFGDDDDELPVGGADEHELGFRATSQEYDELGVDLSPWPPLLAMLDSTEPEMSPDDRPFTPIEGIEGAHALELRAESMRQYSERGAQRTGELDRTEVGVSDDNRDVVAGRDQVEIDGMLEEHTGHGLVHVADEVEMNVGGPLRMHAHLEDNIIMGGVMTDEWKGGTFITAAMSDDMAAGLGLRCTAPLDLWVHGLMGMEERPGTCAADGLLFELAGTLYEREYGPSAHVALVARHSGTVVTTMKTGFRPLMKTALGVRNLIPGGGGGGGNASASPPAAPPAPGGGGGGETAGAVTLTAAEAGVRSGAASPAATTPTRSSLSSAPWKPRPTPTRSRTCSTPRAPPTTSTIWPESRPRGRGTSRSPTSTSSRSRSPPSKQPPNRHPGRARPPRGPGASSPRRSITPCPGPKGTTSGVPTAHSTIGINSTGRN